MPTLEDNDLDAYIDSGIDQAGVHANDPSNHTNASQGSSSSLNRGGGSPSRISMPRNAQTGGGNNQARGGGLGGGLGGSGGPGGELGGLSPRLQQLAKTGAKFFNSNRGTFGAGGGAVGLIAVIIAMFFALLPLKLESLLENEIQDHFDGAVKHAIERRSEKIMLRY